METCENCKFARNINSAGEVDCGEWGWVYEDTKEEEGCGEYERTED